jgi:hypothetical protein
MADDMQPESEQQNRDALAAAIRSFHYKTWGSQPTADGRWECYFDIVATRGGSRMRTYGGTEIEAMERMVEVLEKEHIDKA